MTTLFDRTYALTVGSTRITDLDIAFKVTKSTKHEPNKAEISVWNLNADHRRAFEGTQGLRVTLEAGYRSTGNSLIFRGDVRNAASPRARGGRVRSSNDGTEIETVFEAEDSGETMTRSRVARSFPPGTEVITVIEAAIDALGIGRGNVSEFRGRGLEGASSVFPAGVTLSGWAYDELDALVKSMGLRWSVQNGIFQLQERGRPLQTTAVLLDRTSGLVGTPDRPDTHGLVKATSLLIPGLDPGRKVAIQAETARGGFEVKQAEFSGDRIGQDWYVNLLLKPY